MAHRAPRLARISLLSVVAAAAPACGGPPSQLAAETAEAAPASPVAVRPQDPELPPTAAQERARAVAALDALEGEEPSGEGETALAGTEGAAEADEGLEDAGAPGGEDEGGEVDPLAPELPKGPEPGSPEADAELAALLDESEITQEEFDAAFRGGGPRVDGDALLFGAGDRTRKRPKISFGKVTATAGKVDDEALRALVEADIEQLEACHAMALTKDPSQLGAAKLRLRYDKTGKVGEAEILQETPKLGEALCACLSSVAAGWTLVAAKGATVELPLALSTQ